MSKSNVSCVYDKSIHTTYAYSWNETIHSYGTDDSFCQKELLRLEFCCEWCNHVERLASTITNNNLFEFVQTWTSENICSH